MARDAQLAIQTAMPFGVFGLIGLDHAAMAAKTHRRAITRAMQEVSVAFFVFEEYRKRGIRLDGGVTDQLARGLKQFFAAVGDARSVTDIQAIIERYLAEHSVEKPISIDEYLRPCRVDHPLLTQLREYSRLATKRRESDESSAALFNLGLDVFDELEQNYYSHCTPLNVRTFARTGGDGVHFSLILDSGAITAASPVVVTNPSGIYNSIVGESLYDFLCLGCMVGYDSLTELFNDSDADKLWPYCLHGAAGGSQYADWRSGGSNGTVLLTQMREAFQLTPWTDPKRLDELQTRFASKLVLPAY